jgi:hypothetical protein
MLYEGKGIRRMSKLASALIAAGFTAAIAATPALAKPKHHVHRYPVRQVVYTDSRPPLEVNRRSWLDPGPVVPIGSEQRYVEISTSLGQTIDQTFTGRFGNETLPRRFELPIKQEEYPLVEFWTPAPRY